MELDAVLLSQSLSQFKKSGITIGNKQERLLGLDNSNGELEASEPCQFRPVMFLCYVGLTLFPDRRTLKKRRLASRRAKDTAVDTLAAL